MENLINFEEENEIGKIEEMKKVSSPIKNPQHLLVQGRMSLDLNNPFDKFEYRATHADDPFECLVLKQQQNKDPAKDENNHNSESVTSPTRLFSNISSIEYSPHILSSRGSFLKYDAVNDSNESSQNTLNKGFMNESTTSTVTSSNGGDHLHKRHQSDSSTVSIDKNDKEERRNRFNSADNVQYTKKVNNLLKMSLMNSPNSPLHSSSINNSSLIDSVFLEAKWIAEKIENRSFEDINNISQHLIDTSNVSLTDADLQQLRISFLENHPLSPKAEPENNNSVEKIADFQETLNRIKKEEVEPATENQQNQKLNGHDVKDEAVSPKSMPADEKKKEEVNGVKESKSETEVKDILQRIGNLFKSDKEEAMKHVMKLADMIKAPPKTTLPVQSIVRQDTFDIDPKTGKRKYSGENEPHVGNGDNSNDSSNGDLMEQLAKLLGSHHVDVSALNLSGGNGAEAKVVVIMPKLPSPIATPVKQSHPARRSSSMSLTQKPQSALKAMENKKLSTPMKHSSTLSTASAARRSSFTAPRSLSKPANPYDQKLSMGGVRKSLMPSMDKTPVKQTLKTSPNRPATTSSIRRSVSLKTPSVPAVKFTEATPTKTRPVTSTPTPSKLATNTTKRLSMAPTSTGTSRLSTASSRLATSRLTTTTTSSRPSTTSSSSSSSNRPIIKKTDFKTPYGSTTKKSPGTTALGGSLV